MSWQFIAKIKIHRLNQTYCTAECGKNITPNEPYKIACLAETAPPTHPPGLLFSNSPSLISMVWEYKTYSSLYRQYILYKHDKTVKYCKLFAFYSLNRDKNTRKTRSNRPYISGGAKKKRAMTLKQVYWHSAISNLNFDICHVHFDAILTKIHAFKQV